MRLLRKNFWQTCFWVVLLGMLACDNKPDSGSFPSSGKSPEKQQQAELFPTRPATNLLPEARAAWANQQAKKILEKFPNEKGLRKLLELPPITQLGIYRLQQISEEGMKIVGQLTSLEELGVFRLDITDEKFAHLLSLKKLKVLDLGGTQITIESVKKLPQFPLLEKVSLWRLDLDNAALSYLAKCPKLQKLNLAHNLIDNQKLALFQQLPKLLELNLSYTQIDDEGLKIIGNLPLEALFLQGVDIKGEGLEYLNSPNLYVLDLQETQVGDRSLTALQKHTQLTELFLKKTLITSEGIAHLSPLTNLVILDLRRTEVDNRIVPFLKNKHSLFFLSLRHTNLTQAGVDKIKALLPECKIYWKPRLK